jgi:hypothetical protein
MKSRNTLFMAALAASVTIASSAVALHSTSASVNPRETVSLTDKQNDGGVSSNVGSICSQPIGTTPVSLESARLVKRSTSCCQTVLARRA